MRRESPVSAAWAGRAVGEWTLSRVGVMFVPASRFAERPSLLLTSLLIIGLICWVVIVMLMLGVLRAAGLADRAADRHVNELGLAPAARVALAETMTTAGARRGDQRTRRQTATPSLGR